MRMQPRQELLDIWRAVVKTLWRPGEERWEWGGLYAANSIGDAEQLLCLLMPASQVDVFGLDQPDRTGEEMLVALESMGGANEVPRRLIQVLIDYYERYTDPDSGTPVFTGGSYFGGATDADEASDVQRALGIVDSFALAATRCPATIGFRLGLR